MTPRPISTTNAPAAVGPYSQGVDTGSLVFCSGQVGVDPATGELAEGLQGQVERALANVGAVLEAAGLGYGDVVKTTVLLADIADFAALNEIYAGVFSAPAPARTTYAVAGLPKGALVEIEAIAVRHEQPAELDSTV